jgi:hypothetical protein
MIASAQPLPYHCGKTWVDLYNPAITPRQEIRADSYNLKIESNRATLGKLQQGLSKEEATRVSINNSEKKSLFNTEKIVYTRSDFEIHEKVQNFYLNLLKQNGGANELRDTLSQVKPLVFMSLFTNQVECDQNTPRGDERYKNFTDNNLKITKEVLKANYQSLHLDNDTDELVKTILFNPSDVNKLQAIHKLVEKHGADAFINDSGVGGAEYIQQKANGEIVFNLQSDILEKIKKAYGNDDVGSLVAYAVLSRVNEAVKVTNNYEDLEKTAKHLEHVQREETPFHFKRDFINSALGIKEATFQTSLSLLEPDSRYYKKLLDEGFQAEDISHLKTSLELIKKFDTIYKSTTNISRRSELEKENLISLVEHLNHYSRKTELLLKEQNSLKELDAKLSQYSRDSLDYLVEIPEGFLKGKTHNRQTYMSNLTDDERRTFQQELTVKLAIIEKDLNRLSDSDPDSQDRKSISDPNSEARRSIQVKSYGALQTLLLPITGEQNKIENIFRKFIINPDNSHILDKLQNPLLDLAYKQLSSLELDINEPNTKLRQEALKNKISLNEPEAVANIDLLYTEKLRTINSSIITNRSGIGDSFKNLANQFLAHNDPANPLTESEALMQLAEKIYLTHYTAFTMDFHQLAKAWDKLLAEPSRDNAPKNYLYAREELELETKICFLKFLKEIELNPSKDVKAHVEELNDNFIGAYRINNLDSAEESFYHLKSNREEELTKINLKHNLPDVLYKTSKLFPSKLLDETASNIPPGFSVDFLRNTIVHLLSEAFLALGLRPNNLAAEPKIEESKSSFARMMGSFFNQDRIVPTGTIYTI